MRVLRISWPVSSVPALTCTAAALALAQCAPSRRVKRALQMRMQLGLTVCLRAAGEYGALRKPEYPQAVQHRYMGGLQTCGCWWRSCGLPNRRSVCNATQSLHPPHMCVLACTHPDLEWYMSTCQHGFLTSVCRRACGESAGADWGSAAEAEAADGGFHGSGHQGAALTPAAAATSASQPRCTACIPDRVRICGRPLATSRFPCSTGSTTRTAARCFRYRMLLTPSRAPACCDISCVESSSAKVMARCDESNGWLLVLALHSV